MVWLFCGLGGSDVEFGEASLQKVPIELRREGGRTLFLVELFVGKSRSLVQVHLDLLGDKTVLPARLVDENLIFRKFSSQSDRRLETLPIMMSDGSSIKAVRSDIFYSLSEIEFSGYESNLLRYPKLIYINVSSDPGEQSRLPVVDFGRNSGFRSMFFDTLSSNRRSLCFYFHFRSQSRAIHEFYQEDYVISSMIKVYAQCEPVSFDEVKGRSTSGKFIDHSLSPDFLAFLGHIALNGNQPILSNMRFCVNNNVDHFMLIKNTKNFMALLKSVMCQKSEQCSHRKDLLSYRWAMHLIISSAEKTPIQTLSFDMQELLYVDDDNLIRYNVDEFDRVNDFCDVYLGNLFLFRFNLLIRSTINEQRLYQQSTQFVFIETPTLKIEASNIMKVVAVALGVLVLLWFCASKHASKKDESLVKFLNNNFAQNLR